MPSAQSLIARLAPPFDGLVVEAGCGEMMGDLFGLGVRFAQRLGCATMQRLPAALEQTVVSCILDQRVPKTIVGLRRRALDKQETGFGEPIQRRLKRGLVELGNVSKQRIGKLASQNRADLGDLTRRTKPIQTRGK